MISEEKAVNFARMGVGASSMGGSIFVDTLHPSLIHVYESPIVRVGGARGGESLTKA